MGKIIVNKGSMGAGKSARAMIEVINLRLSNIKVYVIKPEADTRDGDKIKSRAIVDGEIKADLVAKRGKPLPIDELITEDYDYIIVDEFHMLDDDHIRQLDYLASKCRTNISMYGITISSTGEPFSAAMLALAFADEILKITTVDKKGRPKMYHILYENGIPTAISGREPIHVGDLTEFGTASREEFYTIYDKLYKAKWGLK